jgi:hypothetical protein
MISTHPSTIASAAGSRAAGSDCNGGIAAALAGTIPRPESEPHQPTKRNPSDSFARTFLESIRKHRSHTEVISRQSLFHLLSPCCGTLRLARSEVQRRNQVCGRQADLGRAFPGGRRRGREMEDEQVQEGSEGGQSGSERRW